MARGRKEETKFGISVKHSSTSGGKNYFAYLCNRCDNGTMVWEIGEILPYLKCVLCGDEIRFTVKDFQVAGNERVVAEWKKYQTSRNKGQ